jgi:hypothetical protein
LVLERLVTRGLEAMCRAMWGTAPRMIPHAVHEMGPLGALRWFGTNMPRYLLTMKVLGPLRTHLTCLVISLSNGCRYCAFRYAYALELSYLRDHGHLFPLDARTIAGWHDLGPRELGNRMHILLQEAGLHVEAMWVDRTLALASGEQLPVDKDEVRIVHLIRMLDTMNTIAIESGIEPDEPPSPIMRCTTIPEPYAHLPVSTG